MSAQVVPIRQELLLAAQIVDDAAAAAGVSDRTAVALQMSRAAALALTHPDPFVARRIEAAIVAGVAYVLDRPAALSATTR